MVEYFKLQICVNSVCKETTIEYHAEPQLASRHIAAHLVINVSGRYSEHRLGEGGPRLVWRTLSTVGMSVVVCNPDKGPEGSSLIASVAAYSSKKITQSDRHRNRDSKRITNVLGYSPNKELQLGIVVYTWSNSLSWAGKAFLPYRYLPQVLQEPAQIRVALHLRI